MGDAGTALLPVAGPAAQLLELGALAADQSVALWRRLGVAAADEGRASAATTEWLRTFLCESLFNSPLLVHLVGSAAAADGASAPFAGSGDGVSPVLEAVIQEFQAAQLAELRRPGGYSKRDPHYLGRTVSTRMTVAQMLAWCGLQRQAAEGLLLALALLHPTQTPVWLFQQSAPGVESQRQYTMQADGDDDPRAGDLKNGDASGALPRAPAVQLRALPATLPSALSAAAAAAAASRECQSRMLDLVVCLLVLHEPSLLVHVCIVRGSVATTTPTHRKQSPCCRLPRTQNAAATAQRPERTLVCGTRSGCRRCHLRCGLSQHVPQTDGAGRL